ncbi:MAG: cysteine desulfurase family protein [Candidatus Liptonbacteria bacterium]
MTSSLYFDYAATTPVDPRVLRAMRPYFGTNFGNPGSLHRFGQEAVAAVDDARENIAGAIGADFREIIFTGSATEANNLALRGIIKAYRKNFPNPQIMISTIEHESVRETAHDLAKDGIQVIEIGVDKNGFIDLTALEKALTPETLLVSIMYANNEVGTVQPIKKIAEIIGKFRREHENNIQIRPGSKISKIKLPLFHTDAVQALQFLPCNVRDLGVDLMTLSAHKIYGPKGTGLLYIRNGANVAPYITGGGQEFGIRSGTENVPQIVGSHEAVKILEKDREDTKRAIKKLSAYMWEKIKAMAPKIQLNGPELGGQKPQSVKDKEGQLERIPNILNIYFPGIRAADLIMKMDLSGLAVSSGSACTSRSPMPSHVLLALGHPAKRAEQSVRISLGRTTTKEEVDSALQIIRQSLRWNHRKNQG